MKIIFTVTTDLSYDQRMGRICSALAEAGFEIELVGRKRKISKALKQKKYKQTRLFCWFDKGKAFYIEYNLRLFVYLLFQNNNFSQINIRAIFFNVISILTGTGYVTGEFDGWGNFPLIFFLTLMFIGGCAGSTTCGIKIFRIQILYLFVINQLKKIIYPKGIFIIKYDKNNVDDKFMASIISFIFLYLVIFFLITAFLSLSGLDFITSISGAATSISNVGPGLGSIIGPNGNFSSLPEISKWILSLGMILGRLELFAILVLFLPSFWRN